MTNALTFVLVSLLVTAALVATHFSSNKVCAGIGMEVFHEQVYPFLQSS